MERKNAVAVITARGGSKRIPHKNIKEFCGRPIIEYSIEAALKSGVFDEVMVSTDDSEIAEIAKRAGAAVPFYRSKEAAGDYAATAWSAWSCRGQTWWFRLWRIPSRRRDALSLSRTG